MVVTKCQCGIDLVFDERLAAQLHQGPAGDRPSRIGVPQPAAGVPAQPPALLTSVCGCGKMLIVEESAAGQMARCPACDRLLGTLHEFGKEHWHAPDEVRPVAQEPVTQIAKPLVFKYSRGGLAAIIFGALMLVTLFTPWMLRVEGSRLVSVSPFKILSGFPDPSKVTGEPMFPSDMVTVIVMSWGAAVVALLAGFLLRGRIRAVVITVAGLCSAYFMLKFLQPTWKTGSPVNIELLAPIALFMLIPLFVLTNLRLRIGYRKGLMFLLGIFAAVVVTASVLSIMQLGREYQWSSSAWGKFKDTFSFIQEPSVLLCIGMVVAGLLPLLQLFMPKLNTLTMSLGATVLLVTVSFGAAVVYVMEAPREFVQAKVPVPVMGQIARIDANTIGVEPKQGEATVFAYNDDTLFWVDPSPASVADVDSGMFVNYQRDDEGILTSVKAFTHTGETWRAINLIILFGGTAVLLIMGLTDSIAAVLATPEDWRKP